MCVWCGVCAYVCVCVLNSPTSTHWENGGSSYWTCSAMEISAGGEFRYICFSLGRTSKRWRGGWGGGGDVLPLSGAERLGSLLGKVASPI